MATARPRVLIIGAGITGLLLGQALKTHNVDFTIYERDASADSRGPGWGLALHWSLDQLISLLPENLRERLPETYVDPNLGQGEGMFPFVRLDDGKVLYENLSPKRVRVSRERLRELMLSDLHMKIKWGKKLDKIKPLDNGVEIQLSDGTFDSGSFLAGCDGTHSRVRELLCELTPEPSIKETLPVGFLGASVVLPSDVANRLRAVDPLFFQGGHKNDSFMFFGILDTPANNSRERRDTYRCQISVSWPLRKGFLGKHDVVEVPKVNQDRLGLMKRIADTWANPFKDAVQCISENDLLQAIKIECWSPFDGAWDNLGGRATLLGDAAHPMPMYRGEAANHSIVDVGEFCRFMVDDIENRRLGFLEACSIYEREMISRTGPAVLASRQACLDAHENARINESSPLISKRAIVPGDRIK